MRCLCRCAGVVGVCGDVVYVRVAYATWICCLYSSHRCVFGVEWHGPIEKRWGLCMCMCMACMYVGVRVK